MPFTIGESRSSDLFGHQVQIADTLSWSRGMHSLRFGGSVIHHTSGGTGSEPGTAVLGTFTFLNTTTAPFDQLTLADVQQYSQPISYGVTSYELKQWMSVAFVQDSIRVGNDLTLDVGLRYDRQTLTDATTNFAPRLGFGWHPWGDSRTGDSRRLRDVLHADSRQRARQRADRRPRRPRRPTRRRRDSSASRPV